MPTTPGGTGYEIANTNIFPHPNGKWWAEFSNAGRRPGRAVISLSLPLSNPHPL